MKNNFLSSFSKMLDQAITAKIEPAQNILPDEKLLARKSDNAEAETQLQLGIPYFEDEEYNTAFRYFLRALAANPRMPSIYIYLAEIYTRKGMLFDSRRVLEKACEVCPTYKIFVETAKIYNKQNFKEKVVDLWNRYISTFPAGECEYGYLQLGNFFLQHNQPHKSVEHFEKFLSFFPEDHAVMKTLSELYYTTGKTEDSISLLKNLIKKSSASARYEHLKSLSMIYYETTNYTACEDLLGEMLALRPEPHSNMMLGDIKLSQFRVEDAFRYYHNAHTLTPSDFQILIRLAFVCFLAGKVNERNMYLTNALKIKSDASEISDFFDAGGQFTVLKEKISAIILKNTTIPENTVSQCIAKSSNTTVTVKIDKKNSSSSFNIEDTLKELQIMHNLVQSLIMNAVNLLAKSSRTIYRKQQTLMNNLKRNAETTEQKLKFSIHSIRSSQNDSETAENITYYIQETASAAKKSAVAIKKDLPEFKSTAAQLVKRIETLTGCLEEINEIIFIMTHDENTAENLGRRVLDITEKLKNINA